MIPGAFSIGVVTITGPDRLTWLHSLTTQQVAEEVRRRKALAKVLETAKVTDFIRMQRPPQYDDEVVSQPVQIGAERGQPVQAGAQRRIGTGRSWTAPAA